MNVSWIDVISPVVTFVLVIVLPVGLAGWVVYRTLTEKQESAAPIAEPEEPTAD